MTVYKTARESRGDGLNWGHAAIGAGAGALGIAGAAALMGGKGKAVGKAAGKAADADGLRQTASNAWKKVREAVADAASKTPDAPKPPPTPSAAKPPPAAGTPKPPPAAGGAPKPPPREGIDPNFNFGMGEPPPSAKKPPPTSTAGGDAAKTYEMGMGRDEVYKTFGIDPNKPHTKKDFKKAQRAAARKYHPDVGGPQSGPGYENFLKMNELMNNLPKTDWFSKLSHVMRASFFEELEKIAAVKDQQLGNGYGPVW